MKKVIFIIILAISFVANIFGTAYIIRNERSVKVEESITETEEIVKDTLSQWDLFTLALMKVESEYNNDAVSSVGAKGYFQMTPIYVKEVNRVHKTNFTFDQVTDFEKAYEIFDLMQKAHNPNYDMEKALDLHNGKHVWYHKRVYKAMDQIRIYEEMRSKVKNI